VFCKLVFVLLFSGLLLLACACSDDSGAQSVETDASPGVTHDLPEDHNDGLGENDTIEVPENKALEIEIPQNARLVTAEDGLRMRDKPTLEGEGLCVIPFEDSVLLLEEQTEEITIGGKTGVWSLVRWKEQTGWVFGGFLTESITDTITIDGEDMEVELFKGTKDELVETFKNYTLKNIEVTASNGFLFIAFRIGYDRYDVLYHDFCCEYGDLIFESSNRITFIPNSELLVMNMGGPEMEKLIKGKTTFHVWMKKNDSDLIMLKSDALTLYFKRRTDENTKN
jgi:hypothetical protein